MKIQRRERIDITKNIVWTIKSKQNKMASLAFPEIRLQVAVWKTGPGDQPFA